MTNLVHHPPPEDVVRRVLAAFDVPEQRAVEWRISPLHGGMINETWRAASSAGSFVVQRICGNYHRDAVLENVRLFRIAQKSVILPPFWQQLDFLPVRGEPSKIVWSDGTSEWRVMNFIPGTVFESFSVMDSMTRGQVARAIGRGLATFRRIAAAVPANEWRDALPHIHDTAYHYHYLRRVLAGEHVPVMLSHDVRHPLTALDERWRSPSFASRIDTILTKMEDHRALLMAQSDLPRAPGHRDPMLGNFIFHRSLANRTWECAALVDIDLIGPDVELRALADVLRFLSTGPTRPFNGPAAPQRFYLDAALDMVNEYFRGIEADYDPATISFLHERIWDMVRCMYLQYAMRFLADFLVGDAYFKRRAKEPETINLERAEEQMGGLDALEWALASQREPHAIGV